MRVLYSTKSGCDFDTLKRLLLLADEIAFLDRPSVTFKNWGTVGSASPMRRFLGTHGPVTISVHEPPSGPAEYAYQDYIRSDLTNPAFRQAFFEGLRVDESFARRFLQFDADYRGVTGRQIHDALRNDTRLPGIQIDPDRQPSASLYSIGDEAGRLQTFQVLLTEASIGVTAAQIVAAQTGLAPISEESALVRLLALRTSDAKYVDKAASLAPWLAAAIVESIVPDTAIQLAKIETILRYRERTQDAYRAFMGEVDRLVAQLGDMDVARASQEIPRIIAAEVTPKVREYQNELAGARDTLFADVLKGIIDWKAPVIGIGFLSALSFPAALAAFVAAGVHATAAPIIDYVKAKRAAGRNAYAYLLSIRPVIRIDAKA